MIFHWPQIVWICLVLLSTGIELERHGKPKTGDHNCITYFISLFFAFIMLYYGGFFMGAMPK